METSLQDGSAGFLQDSIYDFLEPLSNQQEPTYGAEYDAEICSSKDYKVFRAMEFGLKIVPSLLFFILGTMRYVKIKDIGQGRVVYSLHFKFKFCISAFMGAAYIVYVFVCWGQPPTA